MMSIEFIINELNAAFNNNVKNLLNYCNSSIKSISNSKLRASIKKINIQKINIYFTTNYNILKNKLNLDINAAQRQSKKRALLIGCDYIGTEYQLSGCINDVENIQTKLKSQYGFNNIVIMTDNTDKKPTKANILDELKNLLTSANSEDKLFLSFSGHGFKIKDTSGDEKDKLDEVFVSLDLDYINDDEIKIFINNNLKKNVTLFALFDCCHSGTILDLRYQYLDSENNDKASENTNVSETVGNIIMISGCMDNQTSEEVFANNKNQGAMTWAFLDTINKNPNLTWKDLITTMRGSLKSSKYQQIPQLSSGKKLDLNTQLCLL
jgi:hypothetical protein